MPRSFAAKRTTLLALIATGIPIAALFGPALFTDRLFAMRDASHFYYPLFEWCCHEWAAGRLPLWNPQENCGVPVLADGSSSVLYPGKLLFLLPGSFALRYKLFITVHVVLAAAGSYWLARAWKASALAAALAAMGFASGGNVVFQYCNVVFLVGAAWLPLAALAIDRMLQRGSWRAALGLGVVLSLMILGGDPQAAYHGLLIAALYAVVLSFVRCEETEPRDGGSDNSLVIRLGLTGIAAAIAFALAAVQILPSAEAMEHSERAGFNRPRNVYEAIDVMVRPDSAREGESRGESIVRGLFCPPEAGSHHDMAYEFSVGPWRLAEYIWPNVGGRMFPTHRRWFSLIPAELATWTPTLYLGLLPLVLALFSFRLRGGDARARWLSWLAVIFTLGSFGYYGLGWLWIEIYGTVLRQDASTVEVGPAVGGVYWLFVTLLPKYVYFRYPAKLLPLVSLGLSQLAAIGFDRAFGERRPRLARALLVLGCVSGIAAIVVWCMGPGVFAS